MSYTFTMHVELSTVEDKIFFGRHRRRLAIVAGSDISEYFRSSELVFYVDLFKFSKSSNLRAQFGAHVIDAPKTEKMKDVDDEKYAKMEANTPGKMVSPIYDISLLPSLSSQ
jgi:hypothetical protein